MNDDAKRMVVNRHCDALELPDRMSPGAELWRYAPARDNQGRALSDLMMLLPGIGQRKILPVLIRRQLQEVLESFGERIQFADLNLRLGILWVTVVSEPGLCGEVADAIRDRISGARVICNYVQASPQEKLPWMTRVKRLLP